LLLENVIDDRLEYLVEGESLVVKSSLSAQINEDELEQQGENIFHTKYYINNKVYNMIINVGSCANIASTTLVEKLNLPTSKNHKPYKLQWLNECNELKVSK
jgi:hypothetical protein